MEETKVIPKKDRVKETINASLEDVKKLYKVLILYKLGMHFEKKIFNKETEFIKKNHQLHQKIIKSVKCEYTFNFNTSDPMIYTTDGVTVELKSVLKSIGETAFHNEYKEIDNFCYEFDKNREFKIIPVFEKIVRDFWTYN